MKTKECFSLSDFNFIGSDHSVVEEGASGVLGLPLLVWNYYYMSQGKGSWDPSILSVSVP